MNLKSLVKELIRLETEDEKFDIVLSKIQTIIDTSGGMLSQTMFSDSEAWDSDKEPRPAMVKAYLVTEIAEMIEELRHEHLD